MTDFRFLLPLACTALMACSGGEADAGDTPTPTPTKTTAPAHTTQAPSSSAVTTTSLDLDTVDGALVVMDDTGVIEAMVDVNLLKVADNCAAMDELEGFFASQYGDWLYETDREDDTDLNATVVRVLSYDEYDKAKDVDVIGTLSVNGGTVSRTLEIDCG